MATRMQQRRGTATQWTTANPILSAGEIGFESDTNKFKMGDGTNHWADLTYFLDASAGIDSAEVQAAVDAAIDALVADAPAALDTLNEIAASLNDDANLYTTLTDAFTDAIGDVSGDLTAHISSTASVHGIADTSALATKTYADDAAGAVNSTLTTHASDTTNVHGIPDTTVLATQVSVTDDIETHNALTTGIHGIDDTAELSTKSYAENLVTDATAATNGKIGDVTVDGTAGNTITARIATAVSDTEDYADSAVSTHNSNTTTAHGVSGEVVGTTNTQTLTNKTLTSPVINTPTGITKSDVGLANVDNTTDANKPISTATQTALDLKAAKAGPTFTGTLTAADVTISGNLTVSGTTTTVNTTNFTTSDPVIYLADGNNANLVDIGFVGSYNDGTYAHQGLVKDSSDSKWKLFKGVTDEPTTTVNFSQGSLDALKVGAFEATTVTPSSGVVFSDGTQTKEGVPSRTPIVQKTASYTLSSLTERDSLIEVASSSATTITIPTNSAVGYPVGTSIDILQTSTGQVTIAGDAGVTVNATPGLKLRTQWSGATLFKRATNTWVVYGDLSA